MNNAPVGKETAVALHKVSAREALAGILHLRVAEGEPYFLYFILGKETVDNFNVRAKESHVLYSLLQGTGGTRPHACALDVHANVVAVRMSLCQLYGVFALATA